MEIDANELFQIIGQKEYFNTKLQAELLKQQALNKELVKKLEPSKAVAKQAKPSTVKK